jgi:hypothetical protein
MRTRTLLVLSAAILLLPGLLWSMEEVEATRSGRGVPAEVLGAPPQSTTEMRIYALQYYPAEQFAEILFDLMMEHDVNVALDKLSNRLFVTAPPERQQQIERLANALDTPDALNAQTQQVMYRIYMLELPATGQNLKPFSLSLERSSRMPAAQLLEALKDNGLQIGTCVQSDEWMEDEKWELAIQGRAASDETIRRVLERLPDSQMRELRWDDDTFSAAIPAAQVTRLPVQLQEHIRKLLGEGVQTVGYWFGNLSLPGEVRAPIGPWMLELNAETSEAGGLELEISVVRESPIDAIESIEILSNSVRGRIGKPIIIGYNRDRYGVRTMGAMVIVPEVDTTPTSAVEAGPK